MPYIKIEIDDTEARDEINRVMIGPGSRTFFGFEDAFSFAYAEVFRDIHVQTGSLKSTIKVDTVLLDEFTWEGTIRVGGRAPGMPRDPAYYGVYELARGGEHFFFRGAHEIIPHDMVNAILEFYSDGKKAL